MPTEATFSYSSVPQAIKPNNKKKFRSEILDDGPLTLMSDPRVVRGNTFSMARNVAILNNTENNNRNSKTNITKNNISHPQVPSRPTYSYEATSYVASDINLSLYLTDAQSYKPHTNEKESQVDKFQELPPEPEYVPRKSGIDKETQVIDPNELFNFDLEVAPMLEVLVKKTIEQAIFEVQSEEELIVLESERIRYNEEKAREIEWMREKEKEFEMELKVKEQHRATRQKKLSRQRDVKKKVAGSEAMRQLLSGMLGEITEELQEEGIWKVYDKEIASTRVIPEIMKETHQRLLLYESAASLLDELLSAAQDKYDNTPEFIPKLPPRRIKFILRLQADKLDLDEDVLLGPFDVTEDDSVGSLEAKIQAMITRKKIEVSVPPRGFLSLALGKSVKQDMRLKDFAFPENVDLTI